MLPNLSRRQWILGSSCALLSTSALGAQQSTGSITCIPNAEQRDFQVRMEVTMEGQVELPKNAGTADGKPHRVPLKADAKHEYQERVTRREQTALAARRKYIEAKSEGTLHREKLSLTLRPEAFDIVIRAPEGRTTCYNEEFLLTADEIELLRAPLVSFAVDRLLPLNAVKAGDTWSITSDALVACLDLDAVQKSEVTARLASLDAKVAKIELAGTLTGSVNNVTTEIQLAAKVQFDCVNHLVNWVALSLKEHRSIGKSEPGFDLSCQIKMVRQPMASGSCTVKGDVVALDGNMPQERLLVDLRGGAGFSLLADRSWRLISDSSRLTVLRMIQQDQIIAQCEFRLLTPLKAGEQLTLEAFQADVKKALGEQFGDFLDAEEKANDAQVRVLRTTVQGTVDDVPVTWCYLHFSDDTGKRVAATFTLETKRAEMFGAADSQIGSSFQFYQPESTSIKAAQTTTKDKR